ncbi:MAG: monoheme cytochrome C [Maribacter sp.]|uniref:monoheme cytochrome C n=1 Tax=Maribacter sp. TaxID=1897614 RepID=UPI003299652E
MDEENLSKGIRGSYRIIIVVSALVVIAAITSIYFFGEPKTDLVEVELDPDDPNRIENGIHVRTGFIDAPGMQETVNNCTSCHSAQLVIQNRMDADRWKSTIDWMQKTQNLWDLGDNEAIIIDYLVKNYPIIDKGRRAGLKDVEWYELQN